MADSSIREYLNSRMDRALHDATDCAEALAEERGVTLSPDMVGELALAMFQTRMALAMSGGGGEEYELPDDLRRESY